MRRAAKNALVPCLLACTVPLGAREASAHEGLEPRIVSVTARIAARPDDAALRLERAEYHRLQREWRAALADLRESERLDPALAAVDLAKARLFVDANEPERALAALDEFERSGSVVGEASVLRARALAQLGRGRDAAAAWDRAVEAVQPPDPDVYFARAQQLFALGGDARAQAIAGLDEGIRRLGGAMQLEELALAQETELGDWDAALARVKRLGAESARPELWKARAAELLERAGRKEEALAAVDGALAAVARAPAHVRQLASTRSLREGLEARRTRLVERSGNSGIHRP